MSQPNIKKLNYSYKREDTDLWVLNTDDIGIDMSKVKDQQIVHFSPKSFGGNHKHPRTEWFIGIGNLSLVWIDEKNEKHTQPMSTDNGLLLFEIPSYLPHAVVNNSDSKIGMLFEYADAKQHGVETVKVI